MTEHQTDGYKVKVSPEQDGFRLDLSCEHCGEPITKTGPLGMTCKNECHWNAIPDHIRSALIDHPEGTEVLKGFVATDDPETAQEVADKIKEHFNTDANRKMP